MMLASHMSITLCPSSSTSDLVPLQYPGKLVEDGPSAWHTATHVGNLEEVFGSWLQPRLLWTFV